MTWIGTWLKRTGVAARDEAGHRALRLFLALDEAHPLLAARRTKRFPIKAGSIVRKGCW